MCGCCPRGFGWQPMAVALQAHRVLEGVHRQCLVGFFPQLARNDTVIVSCNTLSGQRQSDRIVPCDEKEKLQSVGSMSQLDWSPGVLE